MPGPAALAGRARRRDVRRPGPPRPAPGRAPARGARPWAKTYLNGGCALDILSNRVGAWSRGSTRRVRRGGCVAAPARCRRRGNGDRRKLHRGSRREERRSLRRVRAAAGPTVVDLGAPLTVGAGCTDGTPVTCQYTSASPSPRRPGRPGVRERHDHRAGLRRAGCDVIHADAEEPAGYGGPGDDQIQASAATGLRPTASAGTTRSRDPSRAPSRRASGGTRATTRSSSGGSPATARSTEGAARTGCWDSPAPYEAGRATT